MPARTLALKRISSRGDQLAHVLAAGGASRLRQIKEEDVVLAAEQAMCNQLATDRHQELSRGREEQADDVELRRLSPSDESADPTERKSQERPPGAMHPREQRSDHRVRLVRAALELRVRR